MDHRPQQLVRLGAVTITGLVAWSGECSPQGQRAALSTRQLGQLAIPGTATAKGRSPVSLLPLHQPLPAEHYQPRKEAHRGETLQLPLLPEGVWPELSPTGPRKESYRRETFPVRDLPEGVCAEVRHVAAQTDSHRGQKAAPVWNVRESVHVPIHPVGPREDSQWRSAVRVRGVRTNIHTELPFEGSSEE